MSKAVRSACAALEQYAYRPEWEPYSSADSADRAMRVAQIQADLAGISARDTIRDEVSRVRTMRELTVLSQQLPAGQERTDLAAVARSLYEADHQVTWVALNSELAEALSTRVVAQWFAEVLDPSTTDPASADHAEVRDWLAESFADVILTDLSERERRDVVLAEFNLDAARADRWIDRLLSDIWEGEPQPMMPATVRGALRGQLLRRLDS